VAGYRDAALAQTGRSTRTNAGWDSVSGAGSFVGPAEPGSVDAWLGHPTDGDLSLSASSRFVDAGVPVPNVSDRPGLDYSGAAPDVGARER